MTSVLIVTLTRRLGGAERMIAQLLEGFRDRSRFTLGLATTDGQATGPRSADARTSGRTGGHRKGTGRTREGSPGIPWDGPTVGLREILFGRYDIIHSHLFLPGLLVRLRRIWDGSFRWVHTVHYGEAAYGSMSLGPLRRWIDRSLVFPHADRIIAVSPSIAREIGPAPHLRLIENAIPLEPDRAVRARARSGPGEGPTEDGSVGGSAGGTEAPPPTPAAPATPVTPATPATPATPGPVTLGTVAHLRKEKGIEDLLEAVRALVDRGHRVSLRIAGDGKQAPALRKRTHELGLDGVVEFCGFVEDVDAFYRSLDVYVQPSHMESFGIAALEAMRFSLPLVVRSVGNLPRLLGQGEFGILVDADDTDDADGTDDPSDPPTAFADAIERVMADPEVYRERAHRGLEHWRARYDPDRMVRSHEELYREVMRSAICMMAPVVTQSTGGIQRQLLLQSRELARRGHRVFVVQRSDPTLETDPDRAERWRHVTILGTGRLAGSRAGPGGVLPRIRGLAFIGVGLFRLWQVRRRVQVLHAHQLHSPTLLGVLGKRLLLKPLVAKVTSSGKMGEGTEIRRLPFTSARIRALREVDRMLVLTPHMADEVRALGVPPKRIRIIPNSVEIPTEPAEPPQEAEGADEAERAEEAEGADPSRPEA
ncbi:MAG: glycosyltransferase, partial [Gemmatimonadota bacterium]